MTRFERWLDAAAMRVATPVSAAAPIREPEAAHDGISRATAIKVIGGGALVVATGPLIQAAPAVADTPCERECIREYREALERRLAACAGPRFEYHPSNTVDFLFKNPFANQVVKTLYKTFCDAGAVGSTQKHGDACLDKCEKTGEGTKPEPVCGARTRTRGAAIAAAAPKCYAPPEPPQFTPPAPPPPPPPGSHDDCANCMSVGGICCGAHTDPTTGNTTIAACNNPTYPCR